MSKLTQEFLDKIIMTQNGLYDMYKELDGCVADLVSWERKNLNSFRSFISGEISAIYVENDELKVEIYEYDEDDGSFNKDILSYPLYRLLTDDWKEEALKEYQAELEKEKQKQRMKEEVRARKAEERERAEYERLKAKFEK